MALDEKLGVWGKDKIVNEKGLSLAKDYYCFECYKEKKEVPAVVFWPMELDIEHFPYCRPCVDSLKIKVWMQMSGDL